MAITLNKLFGTGALPDEIRGELRTFLLQIRHERNATESAATQAAASVARMQNAAAPVEQVEQSLGQFEQRLKAVEKLAARLTDLQKAADALSAGQRDAAADVSEVSHAATAMRADVEEMKELLGGAIAMRAELGEFLEMRAPFESMRVEVADLFGNIQEIRDAVPALRDQHDEMQQNGAAVAEKMSGFEQGFEKMQRWFESVDDRAGKLEAIIQNAAEVAAKIPDVRRELGTLKALGDYVAQRITEVQQQREVVDQATSRGARLGEILRRVDREIRTQQENLRFMAQLQERVDTIRATQLEIMEQSEKISAFQRDIASEDESRRQEMTKLRDGLYREMAESVTRFEFEREGMKAVSEQVFDLRRVVAEVERRLQSFDSVRTALTEVQKEIEQVTERVASTGADVANLEGQAAKVRVVGSEVDRVEGVLQRLTERLDDIKSPVLKSVDEAEQRLTDLHVSMESLEARSRQLDGYIERVRTVGLELDRREAALEQALARLDQAVGLRDEAASALHTMRSQAQDLTTSLESVGSRAQQLQQLQESIDRRAVDLEAVRDQIRRFEERLAKWEATESTVAQALDDATDRRATVEALRADIHRMFAIAEQTTESARAVAGAREEILRSQEQLESVVAELKTVREEANRLEARKQQIAEIEAEVSRAEALMIDLRSTVETMHHEKAFLTQVVDTVGSLRFHAKQAEALIATLREERELSHVPPQE